MDREFSGYIKSPEGLLNPATLRFDQGLIHLTIIEVGGFDTTERHVGPKDLLFQGSAKSFTLLGVQLLSSRTSGHDLIEKTYRVWCAVADFLTENGRHLASEKWLFYFTDLHKVLLNSGVKMSASRGTPDGPAVFSIQYSVPPPIRVDCGDEPFSIEFVEEASIEFPSERGAGIKTRSALVLKLHKATLIEEVLPIIEHMRQLFALVLGRQLSVEGGKVWLLDGDEERSFEFLGPFNFLPGSGSKQPPLTEITPENLGTALGTFFANRALLLEPMQLHFDGITHSTASPPRRFQSLIQSVEGFHRRSFKAAERPFKPRDLRVALKSIEGLTDDWIDKIINASSYVNEPSLKDRLSGLFMEFKDEVVSVFPALIDESYSREYLKRIVSTRNYLAHRMYPTNGLLEGLELHNAAEFLKVLSHLSLFRQLSIPIEGLGQRMIQTGYVQLAV